MTADPTRRTALFGTLALPDVVTPLALVKATTAPNANKTTCGTLDAARACHQGLRMAAVSKPAL